MLSSDLYIVKSHHVTFKKNDIQLIACADVRLPFCLRHSPTLFLSEPLFASRTASIQVLVGKGSPVQVLCSDPSPNSKLIKIIQKYRCNMVEFLSSFKSVRRRRLNLCSYLFGPWITSARLSKVVGQKHFAKFYQFKQSVCKLVCTFWLQGYSLIGCMP